MNSTLKLKVTIDNLIEQTNQITSDANKLTKALSGESKTQGDYGELKLQMLLRKFWFRRKHSL